jgi:hypothetical protein
MMRRSVEDGERILAEALAAMRQARRGSKDNKDGVDVAGKNKGGRETRKPKQDQNKKPKGQTPPPGGVEATLKPPSRGGRN